MSATTSPRLHQGFGGRRGRKVFRKVSGAATASHRVPLRRDIHPRDRGPRGHPPAAPTGSGPGTRTSSSRSGEATTTAVRSTYLLHFCFQVHAGRRRGSVPRPRSRLRELRRGCHSYSPCALELPQPGSAAAGTWNKEALAANGSGAAPGSGQSARAARTFAA